MIFAKSDANSVFLHDGHNIRNYNVQTAKLFTAKHLKSRALDLKMKVSDIGMDFHFDSTIVNAHIFAKICVGSRSKRFRVTVNQLISKRLTLKMKIKDIANFLEVRPSNGNC